MKKSWMPDAWLLLLHNFIQLRFNSGSNPACDVLEICDGEDLWQ